VIRLSNHVSFDAGHPVIAIGHTSGEMIDTSHMWLGADPGHLCSHRLAKDGIPLSKHPMEIAGLDPLLSGTSVA
jgi:hypothetical protein